MQLLCNAIEKHYNIASVYTLQLCSPFKRLIYINKTNIKYYPLEVNQRKFKNKINS